MSLNLEQESSVVSTNKIFYPAEGCFFYLSGHHHRGELIQFQYIENSHIELSSYKNPVKDGIHPSFAGLCEHW
jgi:hypothetical protein